MALRSTTHSARSFESSTAPPDWGEMLRSCGGVAVAAEDANCILGFLVGVGRRLMSPACGSDGPCGPRSGEYGLGCPCQRGASIHPRRRSIRHCDVFGAGVRRTKEARHGGWRRWWRRANMQMALGRRRPAPGVCAVGGQKLRSAGAGSFEGEDAACRGRAGSMRDLRPWRQDKTPAADTTPGQKNADKPHYVNLATACRIR